MDLPRDIKEDPAIKGLKRISRLKLLKVEFNKLRPDLFDPVIDREKTIDVVDAIRQINYRKHPAKQDPIRSVLIDARVFRPELSPRLKVLRGIVLVGLISLSVYAFLLVRRERASQTQREADVR